MRRAETIAAVAALPQRLRAAVPGITLRTTFLVGFPGETEADFRHLLDYAAAARFEHVGVFAYSAADAAAAAAMPDEAIPVSEIPAPSEEQDTAE
jgi:ribosomal protein S12 methylthiotransferase